MDSSQVHSGKSFVIDLNDLAPPRSETIELAKSCVIAAVEALSIVAIFIFIGAIYDGHWSAGNHVRNGVSIALLYVFIGFYRGTFSVANLESAHTSIKFAVTSTALAFALRFSLLFISKDGDEYSRLVTALGLVVSILLLAFLRLVGRKLYKPQASDERVAIVIAGGALLKHPSKSIVRGPENLSQRLLRDQDSLSRFGDGMKDFARVIVSCPIDRRAEWALVLQSIGVRGEVVSEPLHALLPIGLARYDNFTAIQVSSGPLSLYQRAIKRLFDLSFTVPALVVLSPMLLIIAVALKLDSEGPIFFRQERLGKSNRYFTAYKFRSMRAIDSDFEGNLSASRDDSRITRVGRFLRRTSLDELPQLLNVLRGEMSLVGPRPHATASTAGGKLFWEISDTYWKRHAAKPGLTGLAQVRGFRGATHQESDLTNRIKSDLEYMQEWSIWKDIVILVKTFAVLIHPNAY
ncbi:exopolysaccharide biosynthesis polyprenyl glycosylphosphotransferase [Erythrobacter arachoides]|uniref:Exopolysaccharide biosynthesis polyprenyl glycosylphosphotransferase n=1 Tax=Aurantiacibacter arachoides TaxID=1850444 RepID=A0A845A109_9SPHN|nr:exopolysaccharide biosynthesis polyprenyl glycosylphosphotransferase [Aurantiacibacter arachoides]MXO93240.1 exopolysaccharide biosynthesis polyprenyl glycosylphosphotransferase [Aurantiacibacter arachoides]